MIGRTLSDRYHLEAELGQGGMGMVYRAHDSLLQREVAIKMLSGARLGTEGRSRLLAEARMVAKLKHPNIVTIHDAGELEGQAYIVMEYVQGKTLNEVNLEGFDQIVTVAKQICAALQHAHEQGIVHRDLKPENVILEPDGTVRLMDFGLALSPASRMTESGLIMGTVFYMSPEQAFGYEVTPQSDLYSLGVILYELTTKRLPFEADDPLAVITQHIHAPVVPPRAKNEDIPIPLNDLILSLLSKNQADRPKSASEVLAVLEDPHLLVKDEAAIPEISVLDRIVRGRIVGRERELAQARDLWLKVTAGQGQTLLISGEPGIGKTRLMREIVTQAEVSGGTALSGECYFESNAPYSAFSQIIRQALTRFCCNGFEIPDSVLDDLLSLTPEQRYQYPKVQPNPKLDPETEQQRLLENMVIFCSMISNETPLLLVVEDAHWGDSGTMAMLHYLIRRTHKQPVMLLVTYREVELKESRPFNDMLLELNRQRQGIRLKLNRLDRQQTREMLAAIFATEITSEFLDGIYHETDGNPFFIEEVCRALLDSGAVYYQDGDWDRLSMEELEIPQGVQVAVESRLTRLPPEHQEVLRMAAILGREFDYDILLEALELDEDTLIEALEGAEDAQMIQEVDGKGDVTFAFVHALVPNAIVESVRKLRRRKLHRRAAAAIEKFSPEDYESLAYHYGEAGDEDQALKHYTLAGERALAAFANPDAEGHFLAALDLVEDEQEEAHLLAQLGIAQAHQSKYGQAIDTWRQAIDVYQALDDKDKIAELYARCGRVTWGKGDIKGSLAVCQEGLSAVEGETESPGIAQLLAESCRACIFNGFYEECDQYGQQALQMAESLNLTIIEVETLATLGNLPDLPADQGIKYLEKAVDMAERGNLPRQAMRAHNNLSVIYSYNLFDFSKSMLHVQRAAEIAHQIKDYNNELFFLANLGNNMVDQGQLQAVEEMLPELEELLEALPDPGMAGRNLVGLKLQLLTFQGNLDQALGIVQEKLEEVRAAGDLQSISDALFYTSIIFQIRRDVEQGITATQELVELADKGYSSKSVSRSFLSRVYSRGGETQEARLILEQARQAAEETKTEYLDHMLLMWAQADLNVAEKNWREAWLSYEYLLDLLAEKDLRWHRTLVLFEWAEAYLDRNEPGDREKARQMMEEARNEFEDMGADGFVQMVQERLASLQV